MLSEKTPFSANKKIGRHKELSNTITDDEDRILDKIIDSGDSMEILKTLHYLPDPYKEVFTLRVLGSLSFKKIGELFGKTESWARVTFFRSKTMIKEKLQNE